MTFGFGFCSVLYGVRLGFLRIFTLGFGFGFGSYQNLCTDSVRSCWVRVLSHLHPGVHSLRTRHRTHLQTHLYDTLKYNLKYTYLICLFIYLFI